MKGIATVVILYHRDMCNQTTQGKKEIIKVSFENAAKSLADGVIEIMDKLPAGDVIIPIKCYVCSWDEWLNKKK